MNNASVKNPNEQLLRNNEFLVLRRVLYKISSYNEIKLGESA